MIPSPMEIEMPDPQEWLQEQIQSAQRQLGNQPEYLRRVLEEEVREKLLSPSDDENRDNRWY